MYHDEKFKEILETENIGKEEKIKIINDYFEKHNSELKKNYEIT